MSDVNTEEVIVGELIISVTESSVKYNTGPFSLPDVVFWMEVVKQMIMEQVTGASNVVAAGN